MLKVSLLMPFFDLNGMCAAFLFKPDRFLGRFLAAINLGFQQSA
jgi:hypothetical protein